MTTKGDTGHGAACCVGAQAAELAVIFDRLRERDCRPEWIDGGRAILADCPGCGGERALVVSRADDEARSFGPC